MSKVTICALAFGFIQQVITKTRPKNKVQIKYKYNYWIKYEIGRSLRFQYQDNDRDN